MTDETAHLERDRLERQYNEIAVLAGGLAHEVRNPLSTIRLNLELLFEELEAIDHPSTHRMLRKMKTIQNECGHLDDVLEAFLQFARAGELTLAESNIADLIRSHLDWYMPFAEQQHIDIRPHLAADLPMVQVDHRLFRQLLDNLIRNAQQAMPEGGLIEIQAFRRDDHVIVEIIDTGHGIPPAAVPKIFEAFFSTKSSGSGLGLPTVRKIVEAHGGTIHCESAQGRGTRFTLSFPLAAAPTAGAAVTEPTPLSAT
ncbi:sensor histidine kinase [Planctomicrobium piriforme]|nr:ATP-binding protein [Planctomicrobium piriforme]